MNAHRYDAARPRFRIALRSGRAGRWLLLGLALLAACVLFEPRYKLLYNPTESAPRGWYLLVPREDIRVGSFVLVELPKSVSRLAAERGYLPANVPILKHVAVTEGHRVCVRFGMVVIDRKLIGFTLPYDGAGRSLRAWDGCRPLAEDELFLLSADNPDSFDSRYFGPVAASAVLGRVIPLWTW